MNALEKRIIELSYKHRLTHISSCLNTVNVLGEIYDTRNENEPVVLGPAHAALALYVVLESHGLCDAEAMVHKHGTHQSRDIGNGIWVSGGSLGQAETIGVGLAIGDRSRNVWLITSDGACAEGCVWEAFHLASQLELNNLRIRVIANGYGGYCEIDGITLASRLAEALFPLDFTMVYPDPLKWEWLQGLDGHYVQLSEPQYQEMMR